MTAPDEICRDINTKKSDRILGTQAPDHSLILEGISVPLIRQTVY